MLGSGAFEAAAYQRVGVGFVHNFSAGHKDGTDKNLNTLSVEVTQSIRIVRTAPLFLEVGLSGDYAYSTSAPLPNMNLNGTFAQLDPDRRSYSRSEFFGIGIPLRVVMNFDVARNFRLAPVFGMSGVYNITGRLHSHTYMRTSLLSKRIKPSMIFWEKAKFLHSVIVHPVSIWHGKWVSAWSMTV